MSDKLLQQSTKELEAGLTTNDNALCSDCALYYGGCPHMPDVRPDYFACDDFRRIKAENEHGG
jgi:hypothetical protein